MKSLSLVLLLTSAHFSSAQGLVSGKELFDQINDYRRKHFKRELIYDSTRQKDVDDWAKFITKRMRHVGGGSAVENLTIQFTYDELFTSWKKSKGHRKNMLDGDVIYAAVGVYKGKYKGHDAYFAVFRGYKKSPK